MDEQLVRITVDPRWAKPVDFQTPLPRAVREIIRRKQPGLLADD